METGVTHLLTRRIKHLFRDGSSSPGNTVFTWNSNCSCDEGGNNRVMQVNKFISEKNNLHDHDLNDHGHLERAWKLTAE